MVETTTRRSTTRRKTTPAASTSDPLHAKHRLRATESAAYLAAIVESADDAIISKTLDGIVTVGMPAPSACSATPHRR